MIVKPEVTLGSLSLIITVLGAIGAGIWQGGQIQSRLVDGIETERQIRVTEESAIGSRIDGIQADIRELRGILLDVRNTQQKGLR